MDGCNVCEARAARLCDSCDAGGPIFAFQASSKMKHAHDGGAMVHLLDANAGLFRRLSALLPLLFYVREGSRLTTRELPHPKPSRGSNKYTIFAPLFLSRAGWMSCHIPIESFNTVLVNFARPSNRNYRTKSTHRQAEKMLVFATVQVGQGLGFAEASLGMKSFGVILCSSRRKLLGRCCLFAAQ